MVKQRDPYDNPQSTVLKTYVLQIMGHVEGFFKRLLLVVSICLIAAQCFILSSEDHQSMANKTVRNEGVFQEDSTESRATLKR